MIAQDRRADIMVFSNDYRLQLMVEVKTRQNATAEWGAQYRQNLMNSGVIPASIYFMFVFPDQVFVWTPTAQSDALPEYVLETSSLGATQDEVLKFGHPSLLSLTRIWLYSVMDTASSEPLANQQWLIDSGLQVAIKSGRFWAEP